MNKPVAPIEIFNNRRVGITAAHKYLESKGHPHSDLIVATAVSYHGNLRDIRTQMTRFSKFMEVQGGAL